MQERDPYAALKYRDYRLYALARNLLFLANQMQAVAIGWELYERTNSPLVLGYVGLVQVIPVILLSLPAGHIADRWNRRQTVLFTDLMLVLTSLGLALLSYAQGAIALIYLCLFLNAVAKGLNKPSSDALLPQLIPMEVYPNAVTWNSSALQLASVLGPALGGAVIALQKSALSVYLLDAIVILIAFVAIALLEGGKNSAPAAKESVSLASFLEGFRFVWDERLILGAITLDLFAVLLGGAVTLLPIYAKDILHVGPTGLGWLRAAPAIGAFTMAIALAHLPPIQKAGKTLLLAVAGFGIATIVFGLSQSFLLSLAMLALAGAFDNISMVIRHTLVQLNTPDRLRGRVSAVNSVFIVSSNELGGFESGLVAELFGAVFSAVSGGIATVIVVLAIASRFPEIRNLASISAPIPKKSLT